MPIKSLFIEKANIYFIFKTFIKTKIIFYIIFIFITFSTQLEVYAFHNINSTKIPKSVTKFAERNNCTNLEKNTTFKRPWYGYKGYDVYIGSMQDNKNSYCTILYKYGITRFATDQEMRQILLLDPPPLPPGVWWQYWHEHRKLYHIPFRILLLG